MTKSPLSVVSVQARAGELIVAHETERDRIAGDLHDDVAQQISGLSLELSSLKRRIARQDHVSIDESLTALQRNTMGLADAVARLAKTLHPGVEQYGLVAALKSLCRDVHDEHGVAVTLDAPQEQTSFSLDLARCCYRGAQEALRNAVTHGRARSAHVVLARAGDRWTLTITDDGCGFDMGIRQSGDGLGLFVVEARARLVRGRVDIHSVAGRGTTVKIVVPAVTA